MIGIPKMLHRTLKSRGLGLPSLPTHLRCREPHPHHQTPDTHTSGPCERPPTVRPLQLMAPECRCGFPAPQSAECQSPKLSGAEPPTPDKFGQLLHSAGVAHTSTCLPRSGLTPAPEFTARPGSGSRSYHCQSFRPGGNQKRASRSTTDQL